MCAPLLRPAKRLLLLLLPGLLRRLLRGLLLLLATAGRAQRSLHVAAQRAQRASLQQGIQRSALLQQRL